MASEWIVVGISGATCSGKSTLAQSLHQALPDSVAMSQDDYFHPPDSPFHVKVESLGHLNWEIMSALDMTSMRSDIHSIISQSPASVELPPRARRALGGDSDNHSSSSHQRYPYVLILEGFLLLNDPEIRALCDLRYYLTLTREECWSRRRMRVYDPPDIPGYFDLVVWPQYEKHRDLVLAESDVNVFDGSDSPEHTKHRVLSNIFDLITAKIIRN